MGMSKRLQTLCALLERAETFADVGCDHGYCSSYMLENGLCERVIFSDISKGSLQKAETLLAKYVASGRATPVLGDGFFGVPKETEEVLIAGMGGSEIVSILSDKTYGFLPKRFVFQPMHDAEKLRRYLIEKGAEIERDFTFFDGKFYDVIVGKKEKRAGQVCDYSDAEYEFGKENLKIFPKAFKEKIEKQLKNTQTYLKEPSLGQQARAELIKREEKLKGVLNGEIK